MFGLTVSLTAALLAAPVLSSHPDPCAAIAGQAFVLPAAALACLKSFPFNETLRQNVLTHNIARVFDFFTFEDYYLNSPPPFQESTTNIRADLARINTTKYATDYDFNLDLYNFITQLNDGHTRWFPSCYTNWQNILPAPVVSLAVNGVQGVYIAPDLVDFIGLLGTEFAGLISHVDWQQLAGARVLAIEGQEPYAYIDHIASTVSGNYLDHGVRVNSVLSSYRLTGAAYSQRLGDLAGPTGVAQTSLQFKVVLANSTTVKTVSLPYIASFAGVAFTDKASYWTNNCAANANTNGVDFKSSGSAPAAATLRADKLSPTLPRRKLAMGNIIDKSSNNAVGLPPQFQPGLPTVGGDQGVMKSYILPGNKTGVMFIGSFEGDFNGFQNDTQSAIAAFVAAGVRNLIIDLHDNGGGFVCLGQFLHQYLAGSELGYPGFQSSLRANPLARKIVASDIALGLNESFSFYTADNWGFFNDTQMPATHDYMSPDVPITISGKQDFTSQRFHDTCDVTYTVPIPKSPLIPLSNIAIVGNGNCASTCAMFTTLMLERHNTKMAVFGGKPGEAVEYKGMAGNQVLEWFDIDSEIKTANLKDDPLAPADLLIDGNFRHNWRTAWSFFNEQLPIAFKSEPAKFRFPYTLDTYNNPLNLWLFTEKTLL
ncbi:unnamed protein product [Mycena citricolor]|uniref:Tail specific protease domain-containing protein n=1 Tax=Mycena citricolor TaxID=2018698 RepID=A0AAD2HNI4_9AGAR|nr:unnamed protein product [Mycena citricolor]